MEFLIGTVIVGIVLFFVFGFGLKQGHKLARDSTNFASRDVRTAQAHDRNNLLDTWRREIANLLVWRDPDHYIDLYRSLHHEVSAYRKWEKAALQAKFDEISKRYPHYEDFDPIGTRLHVLYADARPSDKELEDRFADITRFQAILCATNSSWGMFAATSDDDLHHLMEYALRIKDTKFQLRLERAISDYYAANATKDVTEHADLEYGNTTVQRVPHFAENRYGVHFKDTNEFGLYGFFVSDDGRIFHSYYRSDDTFEEVRLLDILHGVADEYRDQLRRKKA
jgi:hypothetical protein